MPGRLGPRPDQGLGLPRIDRPISRDPAKRTRRRGESGGGDYSTVVESYNSDSDYKRWRSGLDYWQSSGKIWADLRSWYLVRSFRDYGALPGPQILSVTSMPSNSSPEAAWVVAVRRRGAIILPQSLLSSDITMNTVPVDSSNHRLTLDVSATLSVGQIEAWSDFIGDQFEDSATGTAYPAGLIEDPLNVVAYTLVAVDAQAGTLSFDLSRPFMRRRPSPFRKRSFWQRMPYDPRAPLSWRATGDRYLCSSHKVSCGCPDYTGRQIADLESTGANPRRRFPRPSAGRTMSGSAEAREVGYAVRWRDLDPRSDRRRECKHVHAERWSLDYPFYEPSDYESGDPNRGFRDPGGFARSEGVFKYHARRELTLDRIAPALADVSGIEVDARDSIPENEEIPALAERRPILWATSLEPAAVRCKAGDWWLQRGTQSLKIFNPTSQKFVSEMPVGGGVKPVIEEFGGSGLVPAEP